MLKQRQSPQGKHLGAGLGLAALLIAAGLSLALAPAQARADAPAAPSGQSASATTPQPPPPVAGVAAPATPAPSGAAEGLGTAAPSAVEGVSVLPFRPAFHLAPGQALPDLSAGATKSVDAAAAAPAGPLGPPAAYVAPDFSPLVSAQVWNLLLQEGFEGVFPGGLWTLVDVPLNGDANERLWNDVPNTITNTAQSGSWSAWPGAGGAQSLNPAGGYADNMVSWMINGPYDLTGRTDAVVSFGLWYETEPSFDWLFFCVSPDGASWDCNNYWSGSSGGWTTQAYWLTSYAGYANVYVAWVFQSDSSVSGASGFAGPYVDEIYLWDFVPPPTPTPDPDGLRLQNGSFESDLTAWTPAPVGGAVIATDTFVDGAKSARLAPVGAEAGASFVSQTFALTTTTNVTLGYWYGLGTLETVPQSDYFCASLQRAGDQVMLVDFGCVDAVTDDHYWHRVTLTLNAAQLASVQGQTLRLLFELYTSDSTPGVSDVTYAWVDRAEVYAAGPGVTPLDLNEPNNSAATATLLACDASNSNGVVGDALGSADTDWFRIDNVPVGRLVLDVNARTRIPASTLDSTLRLYASDGTTLLAYNDDDGVTYDSYIAYTNTVAAATLYASLTSYAGDGAAAYTYELQTECNATSAPPTGGAAAPPPADTWTVMLYLNAEDPNFEATLRNYRTAIEGFIGGKSAFLTVTILYDGPANSAFGDSGTTRYVVQPGGAYTNGVNRISRGEENMGDPATLRDFVDWSMSLYPAENYFLAIDDHGDGVYGTSVDSASAGDQLTPPEIYSALKDATQNGDPNRKIDILDFEACLMGLAENAYDMRQWADYVVFSQQISWGINTYPVYFSDLAAADTPLTVGGRIIDRYSVGATAGNFPHTISLIDTSQMPAVRTATDNLANALISYVGGNGVANVLQARGDSQAFAATLIQATNPDFAEYVDLADFAAQAGARGLVSPAIAAAVRGAVDAAVVAERHVSGGVRQGNSTFQWEHGDASGLSIYYPLDRGSQAFTLYTTPSLYQMSVDGTWDDFLKAGVPAGTGGGGGRGGMSSSRAQDRLLSGNTFVSVKVYLPVLRR